MCHDNSPQGLLQHMQRSIKAWLGNHRPAAAMPAQPAPCPAAGSSGGIIATEEDGGPDAEQHLAQVGALPSCTALLLQQRMCQVIVRRPG